MRNCPQCSSPYEDAHKFCPSCGFPVGQVATQSDDPLIGKTLPGGYVIIELVGIGGMGRVYRAEQTNLGRTVAVKIVHPHLMGEENAVARFITEARAASRLNHPNSVGIIDFGKTPDGQFYLVMEFLRGHDLSRVAYEEGPLPFRRIVDVLRQVLAALAEAHSLEIIHRDLKPENVILSSMRTGGDFVKVVDFGLAKMREEAGSPSITSPGIVCGTPEYMSPEQGRGDPLDARSDVYAVGVILYQLLTGKLPFEAESPTQVVLLHLTKEAEDPRKVAPEREIPTELVSVLKKSLTKEAAGRYQSADELSNALLEAMTAIEAERGNRLSARADLLCPHCGTKNAGLQKFCGQCGSSLSLSLPPSAGTRPGQEAIPRAPRLPSMLPPESRRPPPAIQTSLGFPLPLVGRDDDIAWLDERREAASHAFAVGRIVGDPGIGKSRLANDFLMMAQSAGDYVAKAGPDPAWAEVGYFSVRQAIERLARVDENAVASVLINGALTPSIERGLSEVFGVGGKRVTNPGTDTPDSRRRNVAEALRWALTEASTRAKGERVVLFIDDMQAIDGPSRNAFADIVHSPPAQVPVLFIAAHTADFLPGWKDGTQPRILQGLPSSVVSQLFSSGGVSASVPPTAGRGTVPLYIDQLLRFVREHGTGAPSRLGDMITTRVERLAGDARRTLQAIAVVGDDANEDTLRPLLGDVEIGPALGKLKAAGMVEETGSGSFGTTHPLLREIALATIPAQVRQELHRQAAEASELRGDPIEVRALHEVYAQRSFEALFLLERVGALCASRGDLPGNIHALRRGLELARRELFRGELDDPLRAVLIFSRKLGEALAQNGAFLDAEGVLRESLDVAGPSGPDRARVLSALAFVAHGRKHVHDARMYYKEALELAQRANAKDILDSLATLKSVLAPPS